MHASRLSARIAGTPSMQVAACSRGQYNITQAPAAYAASPAAMIARSLISILYCGFAPRVAARTNLGLSLRGAYAIHWVGMLLVAASIVYSTVVVFDEYNEVEWFFARLLHGDLHALARLLLTVAITEVAWLLLGMMLLGTASHNEPLRDTHRHAQRTAWVHTGQVALAILACSTAILWIGTYLAPLASAYYSYRYEGVGTMTLGIWLAGHRELIFLFLIATTIVWSVWGLLRAATLPRAVPPQEHPTICEYCGYNLSHIETHARCPECGVFLHLSLADHRRPTAWTSGRRLRIGAWLTCAWHAWFKPENFFRSMSTMSGVVSALGSLMLCLVLSAITTWAACVACVFTLNPTPRADEDVYDAACFAAFGMMVILATVAYLVGTVIGIVVSRQEQRNRTGAAFQVACYCGGWLPVWALASTTSFITAMFVVNKPMLFPYVWLVLVAWFGLNTVFLVLYAGSVARRMKYVRYANT